MGSRVILVLMAMAWHLPTVARAATPPAAFARKIDFAPYPNTAPDGGSCGALGKRALGPKSELLRGRVDAQLLDGMLAQDLALDAQLAGDMYSLGDVEKGEDSLWLTGGELGIQIENETSRDLSRVIDQRWPGAAVYRLGARDELLRVVAIPVAHDANQLLSPVLGMYLVTPDGLLQSFEFRVSRPLVEAQRAACTELALRIARTFALGDAPSPIRSKRAQLPFDKTLELPPGRWLLIAPQETPSFDGTWSIHLKKIRSLKQAAPLGSALELNLRSIERRPLSLAKTSRTWDAPVWGEPGQCHYYEHAGKPRAYSGNCVRRLGRKWLVVEVLNAPSSSLRNTLLSAIRGL